MAGGCMYKSAGRFFSTHGSLATRAVNLVGEVACSAVKKADSTNKKARKSRKKQKVHHYASSTELMELLIQNWHLLRGVGELTPEKFTGKCNRRLVLRVYSEPPSWMHLPFSIRRETAQYDVLIRSLNRILKPYKVDVVDFER
jgi:hypothetical protein